MSSAVPAALTALVARRARRARPAASGQPRGAHRWVRRAAGAVTADQARGGAVRALPAPSPECIVSGKIATSKNESVLSTVPLVRSGKRGSFILPHILVTRLFSFLPRRRHPSRCVLRSRAASNLLGCRSARAYRFARVPIRALTPCLICPTTPPKSKCRLRTALWPNGVHRCHRCPRLPHR